MENWKKICINLNATIRDAIATIESGGEQIAIMVKPNGELVGTVTDGDIRRGILRGEKLNNPVEPLINKNPLTMGVDNSKGEIIKKMECGKIRVIPVIDNEGRVVNVDSIEELNKKNRKENCIVIMAGGLGSRLKSLTKDCPKPMLPIGGKPILEIIIEELISQGYYKFFISINYLGEIIKEHFKTGEKWGVDIRYIEEKKRLGTGGALTLLPCRPKEPILIMNGDIISKINFNGLVEYHEQHGNVATMVVRQYSQEIPYGVLSIKNNEITNIEEKPLQSFFINAGVYVIDSKIISLIPNDEFYDMPTLFKDLISKNMKAQAYPIYEKWIDVGKVEDLDRARNNDY